MKKKKIIWIALAVVIVLGIIGAIGSDGPTPESASTVKEESAAIEESSAKDTEQTSELEVAEEVQETEVTVKSETNDGYAKVGDVFTGSCKLTITDIGIIDSDVYVDIEHIMYVSTEIENISNEVQMISQNQDTVIYIDDYQYDAEDNTITEIAVDGANTGYIELNPGRKCKFIFYSLIPDNAANADKVEFAIFSIIPVLFKDNGNWLYGVEAYGADTAVANNTSTATAGIGNPIIDANPDRYIPEGITGEIDVIDDGFYADSGNIDLVPGEYYITGGASAILTITENTISMSGGKNNFENAEIKSAENGSPQYWVYVDGNYYAVVSFFDGGLYFRTDEADGEEDWDEGFYSKF